MFVCFLSNLEVVAKLHKTNIFCFYLHMCKLHIHNESFGMIGKSTHTTYISVKVDL